MKKLLSILLLTALLLTLFASCSKSGNGENNENTDTPAGGSQTSAAESITERLSPDLPEENYGGHEFNIFVTSDPGDLVRNDFFSEGITGDIIKDAIYLRNTYVEEKYGVKINNLSMGWQVGNAVTQIRKSSTAGDYAYDAAMTTVYDACNLAMGGFIKDLKNVPYIDLTRPWWDQKANRDLQLKGKMYFTTGDISQVSNDSTYAVLFNKKLVRDYSLPDIYEIVKSGKWTYDRLAELGREVGSDLDGNGVYDEHDLYGAIVEDDTMMAIINSIGERCAKVNANGEIEISLYNDRTISAVKKYIDWVFDKTSVFAYQRFTSPLGDGLFLGMYQSNQALFLLRGMETIAELRAMETDFGILPFPKLDESQTDYYSPVGAWKAMFISMPDVQENPERTAVIIEALAAESSYTMRPAYYDLTLKGKLTRDTESVEMLDIILSTRIYDFGWYYQFGALNNGIMDMLRNYNSDFASMYEKNAAKAETDVRKVNDEFSKLLD